MESDERLKIEVKDASTLLNMFFKDIQIVLDGELCDIHEEDRIQAKNRISDFISNHGDDLFLVDVEEVSGRTLFLRRSLFQIIEEDNIRIGVFMNMLLKNSIIITVNEKNNQKGISGEYDQGADTQFIINLRSLVSQVYDRFCPEEGEQ